MTEREAIEKIKYRIDTASEIAGKGEDGKAFEDLEMAILALEYTTTAEFKDIKERMQPKEPIEERFGVIVCPMCRIAVGRRVAKDLYEYRERYCHSCGQKLDWE